MYTEFNKANLKKFRNDVNDRLSKLGDEIGVKFEVGKIGYSSENLTVKIEANIIGSKNQSEKALELYTHYKVGDALDSDKNNIVIGYETKSRSYPLLVRKPNGKVYKYRYETPKKYYDSLEGNLTLTDKQGNKI